jgi:hypothetical protein
VYSRGEGTRRDCLVLLHVCDYVILPFRFTPLSLSINQLGLVTILIKQLTPCIQYSYYTHSSMLTSRQIAKELISRKQQNPDTSITTSSYEMIDSVDADTSDDAPRRHFWGLNLRKRGNIHDLEVTGTGRRVVSEPLPAGLRKLAVLWRFRFGRHDQDLEEEEEGDLTISTETVCSSRHLETIH